MHGPPCESCIDARVLRLLDTPIVFGESPSRDYPGLSTRFEPHACGTDFKQSGL